MCSFQAFLWAPGAPFVKRKGLQGRIHQLNIKNGELKEKGRCMCEGHDCVAWFEQDATAAAQTHTAIHHHHVGSDIAVVDNGHHLHGVLWVGPLGLLLGRCHGLHQLPVLDERMLPICKSTTFNTAQSCMHPPATQAEHQRAV